jgi:hypothetical protein
VIEDLESYRGTGQFGRAYEIMLENDCNAPGSVDRVLVERMVRLCPETVGYLYEEHTPAEVRYQRGTRPELERHLDVALACCESGEEKIEGICRFCNGLQEGATDDLDGMQVGGTEEEIIRRRSDWCTEVARVGCVLCQIAGLPARMVYLFDTGQAYSGHAITEVYRSGVWGAACPHTDVVYRHRDGRPASVWDLKEERALVELHRTETGRSYTRVGQFRGAAVSNYFVWESHRYDYTVSGINGYYRSILEMSLKGWPGGLRWVHGEDGI